MKLPDAINIFNLHIYTFGVFLVLGLLFSIFVIWYEGRKDGFDEDKFFDLFVISSLSGLFLGRIFFVFRNNYIFEAGLIHIIKFWTDGIDPVGVFIGVFIPLFIFSRYWKWSIYRLLDIYALSMSLGFSIVLLGYVGLQRRFEFLVAFALWLLLYALLSKYRNVKLKSGVAFSIFLIANVLLGVLFFRSLFQLIFYGLLVIFSMLNLFFRVRNQV